MYCQHLKWAVSPLILILGLTTSAAGQPLQRTADEGIDRGHYIAGGVLGSTIGLGIGHAVNGHYAKTGWIFSLGEGAALGAFIGGLATGDTFYENGEEKLKLSTGAQVAVVAGGLAYLGFKIWEIIDVWTRPTLRQAPAGRQSASFMVVPTVVGSQGGLALGGMF
jgi:hypothetical protein